MSSSGLLDEKSGRQGGGGGNEGNRFFQRLTDACVFVGINLEAPLAATGDEAYASAANSPSSPAAGAGDASGKGHVSASDGPFDTAFTTFSVLSTVTGDPGRDLGGHHQSGGSGGPNSGSGGGAGGDGGPGSGRQIQDYTVPAGVLDMLPMFCFPAGARVRQDPAALRESRVHSFVIKEGGYYATCLTFYRREAAGRFLLAWECTRPRAAATHGTQPPPAAQKGPGQWQDDSAQPQQQQQQQQQQKDHSRDQQQQQPRHVYMPMAACLVSRWPMFRTLRDCLVAMRPLLPLHIDNPAAMQPMLAFLTRIPVPLPGPAQLRFRLNCEVLTLTPPAAAAPHIACSPRLLFLTLAPADVLRLLTCLLLERRCVFFSRDCSLLTPVIEVRAWLPSRIARPRIPPHPMPPCRRLHSHPFCHPGIPCD